MAKLHELNESASAIVSTISLTGVYGERLRGMGVFPGRRIKIVRRGSPLIVEVSGGRFALARELADAIEVEQEAPTHQKNGTSP